MYRGRWVSARSGLQVETTRTDDVVTARITHADSDPDPEGFATRVHELLRDAKPTRVIADVRALEPMSPAAAKQLATWFVRIHEEPAEQRYPVEIVASSEIPWPRSLAALRRFASGAETQREPSAQPVGLPETIVNRFRTVSLERLLRVESVCSAAFQGTADPETLRTAARDLHTLKGDAGIIGFADVRTLAQKLEELFAMAGQLQYRVSQDFELLVVLALQLAQMLVRGRPGVDRVDLQGFVSHVDDLLREGRTET